MSRLSVTFAVALTFTTIAGTSQSLSQFYDGNELHDLCKTNRAMTFGFTAGLVDATAASLYSSQSISGDFVFLKSPFCIPDKATLSQVTDVICQSLDQHPASRHAQAATLAVNALTAAWPCL